MLSKELTELLGFTLIGLGIIGIIVAGLVAIYLLIMLVGYAMFPIDCDGCEVETIRLFIMAVTGIAFSALLIRLGWNIAK